MKATRDTQTETRTHAKEKGALELLKADHEKVTAMFSDFE